MSVRFRFFTVLCCIVFMYIYICHVPYAPRSLHSLVAPLSSQLPETFDCSLHEHWAVLLLYPESTLTWASVAGTTFLLLNYRLSASAFHFPCFGNAWRLIASDSIELGRECPWWASEWRSINVQLQVAVGLTTALPFMLAIPRALCTDRVIASCSCQTCLLPLKVWQCLAIYYIFRFSINFSVSCSGRKFVSLVLCVCGSLSVVTFMQVVEHEVTYTMDQRFG